MPVSEYICVPIDQPKGDQVSADTWDHWWGGKDPYLFYPDDLLLEDLINKVTPVSGRIVEAGCGQGRWVELLSAEGYDCLGVEYAPATVESARRLFPNCQFLSGDITNMDCIDSDAVDTYISWGVFEHFPEGPDAALKEAFRILRPGGMLIATVPNFSTYRKLSRPVTLLRDYFKSKRVVQRIMRKSPSKTIWFEYQFELGELSAVLRRQNFEVLLERPIFISHGVYNASALLRGAKGELVLNALGRWVERWCRKRRPSLFAHMNLYVAMKPFRPNEQKTIADLVQTRTTARCESAICRNACKDESR